MAISRRISQENTEEHLNEVTKPKISDLLRILLPWTNAICLNNSYKEKDSGWQDLQGPCLAATSFRFLSPTILLFVTFGGRYFKTSLQTNQQTTNHHFCFRDRDQTQYQSTSSRAADVRKQRRTFARPSLEVPPA